MVGGSCASSASSSELSPEEDEDRIDSGSDKDGRSSSRPLHTPRDLFDTPRSLSRMMMQDSSRNPLFSPRKPMPSLETPRSLIGLETPRAGDTVPRPTGVRKPAQVSRRVTNAVAPSQHSASTKVSDPDDVDPGFSRAATDALLYAKTRRRRVPQPIVSLVRTLPEKLRVSEQVDKALIIAHYFLSFGAVKPSCPGVLNRNVTPRRCTTGAPLTQRLPYTPRAQSARRALPTQSFAAPSVSTGAITARHRPDTARASVNASWFSPRSLIQSQPYITKPTISPTIMWSRVSVRKSDHSHSHAEYTRRSYPLQMR